MDLLSSLALGFRVVFTPANLGLALVGVTAGTLVGILPGLGPAATIAILLPLTFGMDPAGALILLAGIYYGAMYGGSTTSILLSVPGEAASVATVLDGYALARQGRAGAALGIAAIGSFAAGTLSVVALMLLGRPLADVAVRFGPPEYATLALLALGTIGATGGDSALRSFVMGALGLLLATVGVDRVGGVDRFTFGLPQLYEGVDFLVVMLAFFAVAEVLSTLLRGEEGVFLPPPKGLRNLLPTADDLRRCALPMLRSGLLGFVIGVLPGGGVVTASFLAYAVEKRLAKDRSRWGKGAIEGVAAPETANNAAAGGALVPLLALGIPGSGSAAMLLGAMTITGVQAGPLLFTQRPDVAWGLIASMYLGNAVLLVLNLPLVPLYASVLRTPYRILYPLVLVLALTGVYVARTERFDLWLLVAASAAGFFLVQRGFPPAPLVVGLVLGPLFEQSLRQSLILSRGSFWIFLARPWAAAFLALFVVSLVVPLVVALAARRRREDAAEGGGGAA